MIGKIPRDGSTVDLQTLFFQLTFDSATEFLFGESVDILRSPEGSEQQLFAAAFDYAQVGITKRNRLGPFVFLYRDKKFDEACKRVHNFVDRFVFRALEYRKMHGDNDEKEPERYVFLNELAKATEDPKRLRDELLNILLAGRDTTAGLLSNTFHVLARRPDIWEKLSKEVDTLEGEKPSYETLRNMKYLRNVLSEGRSPMWIPYRTSFNNSSAPPLP
jgi:cytochrome P450